MGIMDYLPQFGQNTTQSTQDQMPQDDTLMQLDLKRKLALADALRQQAAPEGQMVSGHYVAPSWTQSLANLANKYVAGKNEQQAIKQYGDYQTVQSQKLGNLLTDLQQGKETKTYDNTPFQIQVPNGQTPTSMDKVGAMQPYETGMKTIDVPNTVTSSTYAPYTQKEFMAKVGAVMPQMLPKMLEAQFEQYAPKKPIELGAGGKLIDPTTYATLAENPKEASDSASTLEKEYRFLSGHGYKGSPEDYANFKRSLTPKDLAMLNIQLQELGLKKGQYNYETGGAGLPKTNAKGWVLHTDKNNNQAYVNPNNPKEYEEAQ